MIRMTVPLTVSACRRNDASIAAVPVLYTSRCPSVRDTSRKASGSCSGCRRAGNWQGEVEPAFPVGQGHGKREVALVVDDDAAFGGMMEIDESRVALVLVAAKVEVDRDAVVEPAENAEQARGTRTEPK